MNFFRGEGGLCYTSGNSGEVELGNWGGGVITSLQKWKIQGGMGSYVKFPLW